MKKSYLSVVALLSMGALSQAAVTVDGNITAGDGYGSPVATYTDQYINGTDATGGVNTVSTYFTYDANYVYGAVHLDSGAGSPFAANGAANIYVYSSTSNLDATTGAPGSYGDGNDVIVLGNQNWGFATPTGGVGPLSAESATTAQLVYNGTDTVEFSIARSLLGNYSTFRYGGQLFAYEFHTGSDDRQPGAIVSVPEPASLSVLSLGGLSLLRRRRR